MKDRFKLIFLVLFCILMVSAGGQSPSPAWNSQSSGQPNLIRSIRGDDLYRHYCASCHGTDARGRGPAAAALRKSPADLTQIAKRNGGNFPRERVMKIIAGTDALNAHGSREMPVWGPIFSKVEWDENLGPVRLNNLANYLESIQQK